MVQYILFPDTVQTPQVYPADYLLIALAMICFTVFMTAMVWPGQPSQFVHRFSLPSDRVRPHGSRRGLAQGYYYVDANGHLAAVPAMQQEQPPMAQPVEDSLWAELYPAQPARKTARPKMPQRKRFRILQRDGFRCQICGRQANADEGIELHIDHKMPLAKGGSNGDDNLWVLCNACNGGKSDTVVEEIVEEQATSGRATSGEDK